MQSTLHNFDRLAELDLCEPITMEAEAVADVPAVEEFRTITYAESEAPGEEFLVRTAHEKAGSRMGNPLCIHEETHSFTSLNRLT